MTHLIKLEVSKKQVTFTPDDSQSFARGERLPDEGDFQVTVVNTSQVFASFQLELLLQGEGRTKVASQWYRIEPHVSAKKPPGDRSTFQIVLLKAPIPSYDTTIPVTVKVLSVELADLIAEATVLLTVVRPKQVVAVHLPSKNLVVYPGTLLRIPAFLYNFSDTAKTITLKLQISHATATWFPQGTEKTLLVDAGDSAEYEFRCVPPESCQTRAKEYSFRVEAWWEDQNTSSKGESRLEVLPFGEVQANCPNSQQWVPSRRVWSARKRFDTAIFELRLANQANLSILLKLPVEVNNEKYISVSEEPPPILDPEKSDLLPIEVRVKRPWIGFVRTRFLTVKPIATFPNSEELVKKVAVNPASQTLELKIRPVFPLLLQLGGCLLALLLVGLAWWFRPDPRHAAPVTALAFMHDGKTIVSGSTDKTLRLWTVRNGTWLPMNRRLKYEGIFGESKKGGSKAVRTLKAVSPNPGGEKSEIAVGLENGAIQIWQVSDRKKPRKQFSDNKPDRVFVLDVATINDSTILFSGYGSGRVQLWEDGDKKALLTPNPQYDKKLSEAGDIPSKKTKYDRPFENTNFSIAALTVIDRINTLLAVGGQFNRLLLWNWQKGEAFYVPYQWQDQMPIKPAIGFQDYLTSLTSDDRGKLMASADNQGFITIWNNDSLRHCPKQEVGWRNASPEDKDKDKTYRYYEISSSCVAGSIVDQWRASNKGQAIRSVALADNGCYLASGGDDGRVMLWPLTTSGKRVSGDRAKGIELNKRYLPKGRLNVVDIFLSPQQEDKDLIFVASDTPNYQIHLYRHEQVRNNDCQ